MIDYRHPARGWEPPKSDYTLAYEANEAQFRNEAYQMKKGETVSLTALVRKGA